MKDQILKLADDYRDIEDAAHHSQLANIKKARQALSDAIDAALAQARADALEDAAEACRQSEAGYEAHAAQIAADAVLRLKDVYTNPQNLDTSVKRVQIIHDSIHEAIQPDIEGHPV